MIDGVLFAFQLSSPPQGILKRVGEKLFHKSNHDLSPILLSLSLAISNSTCLSHGEVMKIKSSK
jgi:hypothetical protein